MRFLKGHTLQIKGIAIIVMLFHHCFLNEDRWATVPYEQLNRVKDYGYYPISFAPFSADMIKYLASFSKICVAMFVFMTGCGMYVSYKQRSKKQSMNQYVLNRFITLISGFLIIFILIEIISIPTGRYQQVYGLGIRSIIYFLLDGFGLGKLLGTPLFCLTWWYMSLAIVLIILFPFMYQLIEKYQGIILAASILIPRALGFTQTDLIRYLFAYTLGLYFAKNNLLAKIKEYFFRQTKGKKILLSILSVAAFLIIIKCRQNAWIGWKFLDFWDGFAAMYVIAFCFVYVLNFKILNKSLEFLGKHSMNIFLIHSFYRDVFFHKFIYSFYYAWLDYAILMGISLLTSILLEKIKMITLQKNSIT